MFRRIMVPVDGSRTSDLGLAAAIRMARNQKAALCVLHVVDEQVVTQNIDVGAAEVERLLESLRDSGRRIIERAQARIRGQRVKSKGVLVENMLRSVADVIVEQARKWRADLIVMGTHGRRGITRVVLGSAAEGVVRSAPVPVLLVRAPARNTRARRA